MSELKSGIVRILDVMSSQLGVGGRATATWTRTGGAEFELLARSLEQWTAERLYGRLGRFSFEVRSNMVPIEESVRLDHPQLQYEIDGNDVKVTASAVVKNLTRHIGVSDGSVGSSPVGFGVDVMSVFSLLSVIWSLLNPRFTLVLPSEIVADIALVQATAGRQLLIEFTKSQPVVKASWGIQFTMSPVRLSISETVIAADYRAGIFSRSQTWKL